MEPIVSATLATQHYHTTCVVGTDGRHEFVCDEPTDLGGQDLGPTPVEVFCGSIAACKAMTARMYADRKEWPVESISCTVRHRLRVQEGSDRPTKVPHLDITIQFTGDLDDEQRARLKEIAERCPVQRMIEGECIISTTLD
tara:strand:- start:156 stop:578 length:423 start_codon:yes stop_codon:yes gene_type:complete